MMPQQTKVSILRSGTFTRLPLAQSSGAREDKDNLNFNASVVKTVAATKQVFFELFPRPLNSIYRRVIDELLVEIHLLTVHHQFRYDPFFALGLVTVYDRFLDGYRPASDKEPLFDALAQAEGFAAYQIRNDALAVQQTPSQVLAQALKGEAVTDLPESIRVFCEQGVLSKYSRIFALGLATGLESYLQTLTETQRTEEFKVICSRLGLSAERVKRDLDFYTQALEQVRKTKESLDEIIESGRKKRLQASS